MQSWIDQSKISKDNKSILKSLRRKVKIIDSSGQVSYGPLHRKQFGRQISRERKESSSPSNRFYFPDKEKFNALINLYNKKVEQLRGSCDKESREIENPFFGKQKFHGVGYANIKLRFCTVCQDDQKEGLKEDLYFVDDALKPRKRTILCLGCMGAYLKLIFNYE